jgi:hypothetical protein
MKNLEWFEGYIYSEGDIVKNPFSGETCELNNIELSLYDFIVGVNMCVSHDVRVNNNIMETYDKCIDYFLKNNIDAYYKLID